MIFLSFIYSMDLGAEIDEIRSDSDEGDIISDEAHTQSECDPNLDHFTEGDRISDSWNG